jgi:hypothetical protein
MLKGTHVDADPNMVMSLIGSDAASAGGFAKKTPNAVPPPIQRLLDPGRRGVAR